VISIKPKYVAPVAKDPVTPAAMPRYKPTSKTKKNYHITIGPKLYTTL
jgi:hypothetical protein